MILYRQNTILASENENPPLMPAIMTPGGALDLATVLLGNRIIFIGQYINSQVAQRVISQLVTLAAIDEEADILVSVCILILLEFYQTRLFFVVLYVLLPYFV